MKDEALKVYLEQVAGEVEREINRELDTERNCRLQNTKEHLRRAWHTMADIPCTENDLI
jgi:hypothetical protein